MHELQPTWSYAWWPAGWLAWLLEDFFFFCELHAVSAPRCTRCARGAAEGSLGCVLCTRAAAGLGPSLMSEEVVLVLQPSDFVLLVLLALACLVLARWAWRKLLAALGAGQRPKQQ